MALLSFKRSFQRWAVLLLVPVLVSCSPSPRAAVSRGCADAMALSLIHI